MAGRDRTGRPGPAGARDGPEPERAAVFLRPGEVVSAEGPTAVTTVLGSCVSVCLHDPGASLGGMNHFLLPYPVSRERSARFGNVAIELLVEAMERLGARRTRLQAQVYGGAGILGSGPVPGRLPLGEQNARRALELLAELDIPIIGGDVGGDRGRRLVFHTDTGQAWLRIL